MSRLPRPCVAALLAVLVTGYVLAGVAWNRRPPAEATLTLTERELPIGWIEEEDTGIQLRLSWREGTRDGKKGWIDRTVLEEVGFRFPAPVDDPDEAGEHDRDLLPRRAWGVLEYEGGAWQAHLADQQKDLADLRAGIRAGKSAADDGTRLLKVQAEDRVAGSRLFLMDIGPDAGALRRKHPDRARFVVAPVLVRAWYRRPWDHEKNEPGKPTLTGDVDVLGGTIHVPRAVRGVLDEVRRRDAERRSRQEEAAKETGQPPGARFDSLRPPAYEVTLAFGRRLEPWVETIALRAADETSR